MKILEYPEDTKLLRTPGNPITPEMLDLSFKSQLAEIISTLYGSTDGIGLAATQVGLPWQLFILVVDENLQKIKPKVYLNPKIKTYGKRSVENSESCLSFKDLSLSVNRPNEIEWEYLDINFNTYHVKSDGYFARVVQHEIDHLNGNLLIDRISDTQRIKLKKWLKERK